MLTIITTISIVLSISLVILIVRGFTDVEAPLTENEKYKVKDRLWGEPEILTSFITPNQPAIKSQAQQLKKDNDMATTIATYNWLEDKYHYETDSLEIRNSKHTVLKGGIDTWNLPVLTLAIKHQNNGHIWVDCEDGTFLLVSLLRANGINAWANIGTVEINGSIYGHAWATVILNGNEYLLETTLGQTLQALRPVPEFYTPNFAFNEKEVRLRKFGADINEVYPPLPPAKVQDLKNLLNDRGAR